MNHINSETWSLVLVQLITFNGTQIMNDLLETQSTYINIIIIVILRTHVHGRCITFRIFPPEFRRYINRRTGTFTICGCGLARMERAISKLRRYIGSNIGLDCRMTDHQCSETARGRSRTARALTAMICNSIMTSRDRNSCYNRPFSTTARNKIHETVVTFMRGIGKKYCVNTFAIHERCRFYDLVSRTPLAPNTSSVLYFFYFISHQKLTPT